MDARRASGAWAVQGGGKVHDPCTGWVGWLVRAQGRRGGRRTSRRARSTCPGVEDREEKGDVGPSSDGPQQKLEPANSGFLQPTRPAHAPVYSRGYLRAVRIGGARRSWARAPWRCNRGAWANILLPARAPRPCRSLIQLSVGASTSRIDRYIGFARAQAQQGCPLSFWTPCW